jgi:hypothetical protein
MPANMGFNSGLKGLTVVFDMIRYLLTTIELSPDGGTRLHTNNT